MLQGHERRRRGVVPVRLRADLINLACQTDTGRALFDGLDVALAEYKACPNEEFLRRSRDLGSAMRQERQVDARSSGNREPADASLIPSISLPKGGGAIQGIGEKFGANPVTGTGSMSVPIAMSPSRFGPALSLSYDSGSGNGPFGLGWTLSAPAISRKTDKGLPQYRDATESDVFILSDAEDLVPTLVMQNGGWVREQLPPASFAGVAYTVKRYRPRIEGLFARIEHWINPVDGSSFWRTISKDNVASLYGIDGNGRIADPADGTRIFKWLLQQSYDDKGNVVVYGYKAEDRDNVADAPHEANRSIGAQRYLKYIRYGNATPYYPDPRDLASLELPARWYFQLAFDYGEHDLNGPRLQEDVPWPSRADPFSTYRAGFEIRSHRLCRRVLMFHEFPELGATPCLVRSTDFTHGADPVATFLRAARQTAYRRDPAELSYSSRSMPPVEFTYSEARIDDTVQLVAGDALENLPYGVDGGKYQWLDLDSEGSPGILTEQGEGWFYKRNVSNLPRDAEGSLRAAFEAVELVATKPSLSSASARQQFVDLAGEGQQCLVQFDRPMSGFYVRNGALEWEPFTPFADAPNIDFANPNLRTLDLDGDGFADLLVSDDEVFTWYASLGKQGFAEAETVRRAVDEAEGPALVFADGTQSIFLADMSGGGLTDLVRIRNGEICYWPNLGYGRFGRKITMSNAPLFDAPEQFDQKRIRLADIDGSGTTDIIYLGPREVAIYSNQSGNKWAPARVLEQLPAPDNLASVAAVDLLGNGTACLVWSSPLPGDAGRQMRYVDLMGGEKPHLLVGVKNNLGAETHIHYVASTQFYLQDRLARTPWITRLPFPVHVVDRVEVYDAISRTRFATRYAYHHGYYDGAEREFRGFGMVEQWDSEAFAAFADDPAVNLDEATALPPVLTRSWFHTGTYLQGASISLLFKDRYYREPGLAQAELDAMLLPDTVLPVAVTLPAGSELPVALTADEARQACRSLKGATLRQEVYALDGTPQASQPYSVSERNFTIQLLQPQGGQRHAAFFTHARETIDYHYERALYDIDGQQRCDPRVSHTMTLAVDAYGNPLRSVSIGYGRRYDTDDALLTADDIARQNQIAAVVSESVFTNAIFEANVHRTPLPVDTRSYELLQVVPQANLAGTTALFRFEEMQGLVQAASDGAHDIPYEDIDAQSATGAGPYRRVIEQARALYCRDDLSAALPLGALESLALPFESYKLAFTPGLLSLLSAKISAADAAALLKSDEGRYQDLDGDGRLWIPSGRVFLSPDPANPDAAFAKAHRYLLQGAQDPFGQLSRVTYDSHELFVARTVDALGNTVLAEFDYRVLQPSQVTDPNGNRSAVAFDVLGMLVATAVMGKVNEPDGTPKGDLLQGFRADLTDAEIDAFFNDPRGQAPALLGAASSRIVYDLNRYLNSSDPAFFGSIARETHVADLEAGQTTGVQMNFSYSDGYGQVIQQKIPAEPGPVDPGGPGVDPRWVGTGWTIFNNKGKPVRQYEPYFTATHRFEFAVHRGVSPTLFYDPAGRAIATLYPNQTYEKVLFDPWWQQSWDVNDTVTLTGATDLAVAAWFNRLEPREYLPGWYALRTDPANAVLAAQRWPDPLQRSAEIDAANKAAEHANTPTTVYLDALGRTFLTVADNGAAGKYCTRVRLDLEGSQRAVSDALDRTVMTCDYDMLGARIHQISMEAGERWMLSDATGKPIRAWDSRGHTLRSEYDALHRPLRSFVQGQDAQQPAAEILVARIEYGEGQPNDVQRNLRTKPFRQFDTAGVVTSEHYDFKGNLLESSRQLVQAYKTIPDWSASPGLEQRTFSSSRTYDALNRPTTMTAPDASVYRATYNAANLLERVAVKLRGAQAATQFVTSIDYDAKGQRERIEYGNGVRTEPTHDPLTLRLIKLRTTRSGDQALLQDLSYAYDPAGNITHVRDGARQNIYFDNAVVTPENDYSYDAIYRLIHAEGREHIGQLSQPQTTWDDQFRVNLQQPGDGHAMRRYQEDYRYDAVGNFLRLVHSAANGSWTRNYEYNESSLIDPGRQSNRLSSTTVGGNNAETHTHDAHGNMTAMPHLSSMRWNFRDQLWATSRQVVNDGTPETTYYVYEGGGRRARKVTERQNGTRKNERIYLGGFELYREYDGSGISVTLERETVHVMDGQQCIALVETRTGDSGEQAIRFQFGNHLDSSALELDASGHVISYEEYYPYGSTSYQAGKAAAEVSLKRYRFTRMERDEETGLSYHSTRYFAPWLGRWTASDPAGLSDGVDTYVMGSNNPVRFLDRSGLGGEETKLVRPTVKEALKQGRVPYAEEVTFELLDAAGKAVVSGRFDVVFLDPRSGNLVLPELKGVNLEALTPNQRIYKPLLEAGGRIRLTGQKGGKLGLPKGLEVTVQKESYFIVGTSNLKAFRQALGEITGGGKLEATWLESSGAVHMFKTKEELNTFLETTGRTKPVPVREPKEPRITDRTPIPPRPRGEPFGSSAGATGTRKPQRGATTPELMIGMTTLAVGIPVLIALIKGTPQQRREIVAGQLGSTATEIALARFGASVGMKAPGWVKLPAALAGAFFAQCAVGGECNPVTAAKVTAQAAVDTVVHAYSSPKGYIETSWSFTPLGMSVNFIKSIFD
jgi:RHS repeat-associated protein